MLVGVLLLIITYFQFNTSLKTFISFKSKHTVTSSTRFSSSMDISPEKDHAMIPTYEMLANRLLKRLEESSFEGGQLWVGIAGGPGAGKSTLAEAVARRVNSLYFTSLSSSSSSSSSSASPSSPIAVVLPMDGFHFSRQQLREMAEKSNGLHTFDSLIARRGSPWTFDASAIVSSLSLAKEKGFGTLPTYSRKLSDPVPEGVVLLPTHRIVLVEGNYLLNWDDEEWSGLRNIFHEHWFLRCKSLEIQRERLIRRHLETWTAEKEKMWGSGEEGAARKADANDVLNAEFVLAHEKYADLVIESL